MMNIYIYIYVLSTLLIVFLVFQTFILTIFPSSSHRKRARLSLSIGFLSFGNQKFRLTIARTRALLRNET